MKHWSVCRYGHAKTPENIRIDPKGHYECRICNRASKQRAYARVVALRPTYTPPSVADRFWPKVDQTGEPSGCWPWLASRYPNGYGEFSIDGKHRMAHRVAYELLVGPIPDGLDLDHLCRNRACVNPAHLEPVTRRENILRGVSHVASLARQTHCKRGHPFDAVNTLHAPNGRECRTCRRERTRAWLRRNRASQTVKKRERRHRNRLAYLEATA